MNKNSETSNYNGNDITLAAMTKVHYLPYLEHSNLPTAGDGSNESERSGYFRNRFLYQFRGTALLNSVSDRFSQIFQHRDLESKDQKIRRIFIMGNSMAYGFGVDAKDKYYHSLEEKLQSGDPVYVIPAAVSAINSTQENILFHLALLPRNPDEIVIMNGWNDIMLPLIFGVRPGDPMIMSSLYAKYESLFFNVLLFLSRYSKIAQRWMTGLILKDRSEHLEFLRQPEIRKAFVQSAANIYMQNMTAVIEGCKLRGISVLHSLQPCGDYLWIKHQQKYSNNQKENYLAQMSTYPWFHLGLGEFIVEFYDEIQIRISNSSWKESSINLSEYFHIDHFKDPVHLNVQGHQNLSQILFNFMNKKSKREAA